MTAATLNRFRQHAAEADRESVAKMLTGLVRNFQKKYGGEFDELLQVANLAFLQARKTYNHRKTGYQGRAVKFSSWVYQKVWFAFKEHRWNYFRWGKEFPISGIDAEALKIPHDFDGPKEQVIPNSQTAMGKPRHDLAGIKDIQDGLTADAKMIVKVITHESVDGDHADAIQHCLLRRMAQDFGWAAKRFWVAVSELREALS